MVVDGINYKSVFQHGDGTGGERQIHAIGRMANPTLPRLYIMQIRSDCLAGCGTATSSANYDVADAPQRSNHR